MASPNAKDAAHARRLLAIAAVLDGASREEAAKIGGMDRQTLRDWVIRFNEGCCAWNTLIDQPWKIMSIARRNWAIVGHSL